MARREAYDAIVVGSGITGGWAAKELTERGLKTLVLEAGRSIDPTDYEMSTQPWELRHRGRRDRDKQERERPVQRECYACDAYSEKFFVRDDLNPYTTGDGKSFSWIRSRQVGGRSLVWGRQVYRWSDLDFEANSKDGHGVDWPIRYADIEPWYDHVERSIGISGQAEGLAQLPDGRFLPPMELNCAEQFVRDGLKRLYGFGECLPRESNYVDIDPEQVDAWGIPSLRIHCQWSDNERRVLREMATQAAEMLNGWNQTWDVPSLFITDGACMTSSANQNPSITYMALTARAVNHAVDLITRGEL